MREALRTLIRPRPGRSLGLFEPFGPPPEPDLLAAYLDAATRHGDPVIDLHGRGGWVASAALGRLRRSCSFESTALTRLLAEIVLRPPDLRHFDAALRVLASRPRVGPAPSGVIADLFASRCPLCGSEVMVDEFIWEGDAAGPARKRYRCPSCRDRSGRDELRTAPVDGADRQRAVVPAAAARGRLRSRFPAPDGHDLHDRLLDLYTPRTLVAVDAIVSAFEEDRRESPIDAALRVALLHVVLPPSRLDGYGGRAAPLRVRAGRLRSPGDRPWREPNPWLLFEEGCQLVRGFIQGLPVDQGGATRARLGEDLYDLSQGTANVVLRTGSVALRNNARALAHDEAASGDTGDERSTGSGTGAHPYRQVPLVLTQPPVLWTGESIAAAYLATALVLGSEAAAALPLDLLFGDAPRDEWDQQVGELSTSLDTVAGVLVPDARVVVVLDRDGPAGLLATVLAGARSGYRLAGISLGGGTTSGGIVEFAGPTGATREPAAVARDLGAMDPAHGRLGSAITAEAVAALQARGEPARLERILAAVLVGLDARMLLGPLARSAMGVRPLLRLLRDEIAGPGRDRLEEVEEGRWWLRRTEDIAAASSPLSDRVEWAVFSLLSTSDGLTEGAVLDRVAGLFGALDAPDEELVRACVESYGLRGSDGLLRATDDLRARHAEHSELVALLVDYGHRLGLPCWIGRREQRRAFRGGSLGDVLSDRERRATLPLLAGGDPDALESVDCVWYLRGRAALLFEVEWTAMIGEPVLRRGPRIGNQEGVVRFLVVVPERAALLRHKIERSALLRQALHRDGWHILKADHLRRLAAKEGADLERLAPYLGLDPEIERKGEQLPLFV